MKCIQKMLTISGLMLLNGLPACSRSVSDRAAPRIAELEVEVASLEAQLASSQVLRRGCEGASPKPPNEEQEQPSFASTPSLERPADQPAEGATTRMQLPIVRLSPGDAPDTSGVDEESLHSPLTPDPHLVRLSHPEEVTTEPVSGDTRPVLKVHGRHEAWVYHRPLSSEESSAQSHP